MNVRICFDTKNNWTQKRIER